MHQLVGHLNSLDPAAGEALRIVSYFDVLIARGAGLDGLLRGAAVLSGTAAGAEVRGRVTRRDPDGHPLTDSPDTSRRSPRRSHADWTVWLEREDPPEPNDEMIVERLALGVELLQARRRPEGGFDGIIDPALPIAERVALLAKRHIDPATPVRILATAAEAAQMDAPSAIVPTRYGLLRATLDLTGKFHPPGPVGFGIRVRADRAPESWDAAIIALRLTDASTPSVDATDLGAMLLLAQAYDPQAPHEDVRALAGLDQRTADILRTLVEADSIRSAAAELGMHHSTVQARLEALSRALGYDPRTNVGKMRYIAAALLLRLTDPVTPARTG
ncbi:helix-turn-helix domain-containing protein [Streptomyces ardesiacus]|uniref:helix-turn-helix domain-containing protein n=1 Tax=Streptomyces ardesiacus TaxID=285564 RepID=UPI002FDC2045